MMRKRVRSSYELLLTDYQNEPQESYVKRMQSQFPHLDQRVLKFFWNSLNMNELKGLFEKVNFQKIKCYSKHETIQDILCFSSLVPNWIETVSNDPLFKIEQFKYDSKIIDSWKDRGTWKEPILVFIPKETGKKLLFEGHTRVGILKGLFINQELPLADKHKVIYLEES